MVIKNIGQLFTGRRILEDVDLLVENGRVSDIGKFPGNGYDAQGRTVIPGFVDSHTHLVFKSDRSDELEERLKGITYLEIARRGGGIARTVEETRKASEEELLKLARKRVNQMIKSGTTTVETKSGYGLSLEDEIKILRVVKELSHEVEIDIIPTFLGAHIIPKDVDRKFYVKSIIEEMLPRVRAENLAEFCDVFCDEGAFTIDETVRILTRAKELGFSLKVHAEEFIHTGVASVASELGAVSCDHLNKVAEKDLKLMKKNNCVAVLLPGTSLFLNCGIPPVEKMRKIGVDMALASDYNPGSCSILSMPIVVALGCLYYRIPIFEALAAATHGGAKALGREDVGMLESGFLADLIVLDLPAPRHLVYHFDQYSIVAIFKKGNIIINL